MKTDKEIKAEIEALEACKAYIPKRTGFGEDNIQNVQVQIDFLKGEIDITADEFYEYSERDQSAILDADAWKQGQADQAPSSDWDQYKPKSKK